MITIAAGIVLAVLILLVVGGLGAVRPGCAVALLLVLALAYCALA